MINHKTAINKTPAIRWSPPRKIKPNLHPQRTSLRTDQGEVRSLPKALMR